MQLSSLLKKSLVVWAPALVAPARPSSTPSWTPPSTPPQTPSSPRPSLPWECVRLYAGQPSRIAVKLVHHVESVCTHSRALYWRLLAVWSQSLSSVPRHGAHSAPQLPTAAAAPSRDPAVSGMSCGWRGGSPTPGSPASRSQLTQNHW